MAAPVSPGEVLDRKYRIERIIGAGGMGVVVTARHVELGQRVAIKFMLPEAAADAANAERFAREARAAVQLRSQHAGRVIDVGRKGDAPYMVMEFLEGQDLDDLVRFAGALHYPVAVQYVLQACEAIAEAHALGIVHRDLKPKNIFLTKTPSGDPCVKVLDFGLAKMDEGDDKSAGLTSPTSVFGSPQYMSPEQMRSTKHVDGATDIWALGVTLYELLTGIPPFRGASFHDLCAAVLKETPQAPSELVPDLPTELELVVLRCLEKEPARRFESVIELAFALDAFAPAIGLAMKVSLVAEAAASRMVDTIPKPAKRQAADDKTVQLHPKNARPSWWLPVAMTVGVIACALAVAVAVRSDRHELRLNEELSPTQAIAPDPPPPAAVLTEVSAPPASAPALTAITIAPRRQPVPLRPLRRPVVPPTAAAPPSGSSPLMSSP